MGVSDYLTDCGFMKPLKQLGRLEALEKFSSYEVALVLLDIQIPSSMA